MTGTSAAVNRAHVVDAVRAAAGTGDVEVGALRRCEYTKSAPLYIGTVVVDGRSADIIVKDVTRSALLPGARQVKPAFLHDPHREPAMYRDVLGDVDGPAAYLGHHLDESTGTMLLVIEHVAGLELGDVGEFSVWVDTARWLGAFHASDAATAAADVGLLQHDSDLYHCWLERAVAATGRLRSPERKRVNHVLGVYRDVAVERLISAPSTLLHGEMYSSNVIVGGARVDGTLCDARPRICPVDWETAGLGPAVLDLAALITGDWGPDAVDSLVGAYCESAGVVEGDRCEFVGELAASQLQLAVQWLGWFVGYDPPPWQARSWVDEAESAAARLE